MATPSVTEIINWTKSKLGSKNWPGRCQAFVADAYSVGGKYARVSAGSATEAWKTWRRSTSKSNIPVGAAVYFNGSGADGHVGIYMGNDRFIHAGGSKKKGTHRVMVSTFSTYSGYRGWGYNGNIVPDGSYTSESGSSYDNYDDSEIEYENESTVYETKITKTDAYSGAEFAYTLYLNGKDITDACGAISLKDDLESICTEFSFSVPFNPKDRYIKELAPDPQPGDKIVFKNADREIFRGICVDVTLDRSVTAFDYGFYLNKQQIIFQCKNVAGTDAIKQLSTKCEIPLGNVPIIPTKITQNFIAQTPAEILNSIIEAATTDQGKNYFYKVEGGKLQVYEYPTTVTIAKWKQASGIDFDVTWALGEVGGTKSIDSLKNKVQIILNENEGAVTPLFCAEDKASQEKYGVLQRIHKIGAKDKSRAETLAEQKLKELNTLTENFSVQRMLGSDDVESGVVLNFSSADYGITGLYLVTSVTHNYNKTHTMSLEIKKVIAA